MIREAGTAPDPELGMGGSYQPLWLVILSPAHCVSAPAKGFASPWSMSLLKFKSMAKYSKRQIGKGKVYRFPRGTL